MAKDAKAVDPAVAVNEIICEVMVGCDEDDLKPTTSIADDLGLDQLDLVEIVMAIEEKFGFEIPAEVADKWNTVQEIVDYVQAHK